MEKLWDVVGAPTHTRTPTQNCFSESQRRTMGLGFCSTPAREVKVGERGSLEAVCQSQRLSARAFGPAPDPDTGQPDAMWGARAQKSGLGGYWAGLLAALLGLSFLSQHARTAERTNVTNAANNTTTQIMKSALSLSDGKETGTRAGFRWVCLLPSSSLLFSPFLSPFLPSGMSPV